MFNNCGLMDLGLKGGKYTWLNNQLGNSRIYSRLDMVLWNVEWLEKITNYNVRHYATMESDHKLLILSNDKLRNDLQDHSDLN